MSLGAKGLAEARRRFGLPTPEVATTASRQWALEDLFTRPGARGEAEAAARAGNASARRALSALADAIDQLPNHRADQ